MYRGAPGPSAISRRLTESSLLSAEVFSRLSPESKRIAVDAVHRLAPPTIQKPHRCFAWVDRSHFFCGLFLNSVMVMSADALDAVVGDWLLLSLFATAALGNSVGAILSIWISSTFFRQNVHNRSNLRTLSLGLGMFCGTFPLVFRF